MAETKRQFEALTGSRIVEGYSLTEGMMACCVNPVKGTNKIGSIGMPLPDVEVRIVDGDERRTRAATGEVGEMIIRAPQHMTEYWNNPLNPPKTLRQHGEGGPWVHTGDLAYMDDEGYVFIVDRKKDMVKTSGFQVWPREIEEVISAHPAVMEVGVAGVPDSVKGEVTKAWVVLKTGSNGDGRRAARVLPRAPRALQGAGESGVPEGTAQDDGRQSAAARARGRIPRQLTLQT